MKKSPTKIKKSPRKKNNPTKKMQKKTLAPPPPREEGRRDTRVSPQAATTDGPHYLADLEASDAQLGGRGGHGAVGDVPLHDGLPLRGVGGRGQVGVQVGESRPCPRPESGSWWNNITSDTGPLSFHVRTVELLQADKWARYRF